ncbi:MAG: CoA pyrophosphatase [bacterium]|nr:CoA pyrophosphatase [bacterium]MCP4964431.1 CoA pyrophosphatase [bacterium]
MLDMWTRLEALGPVQYPAEAKAAVLVPLYRDSDGRVRVILTKRPEHMRTHPGDVVFPGGRLEEGESPEQTAKREACEEIGLPEGGVEIVGGLTPLTTRDPGNLIVPVVARVQRPAQFVLQVEEVETVIEPMLLDLLDEDRWRTSDWFGQTLWFYEFDEGIMWGATAFMMREFLHLLRG